MKPYEDNHILIANKPPNIATQPDFQDQMRAYIKKKYKKPGEAFLEPAHRLDKPVSGLVLFARTSKALSRLNALMREQKIERVYLAKVSPPLHGEGTLEDFMAHGDHRAIPGDKRAVLHYRSKGDLVEIQLETGRYHQIRYQLAKFGHPIIGDTKYGGKGYSRLLLHSSQISLTHPVKKIPISVTDLPKF
ncbi:MAG: tRNA pseudouridine synthase C [Chlamydiia bacterium]|nr:tRNA pseudouridine synthase C [Chlamydiia bacterium]MCH9616153.1 tRNA pseudouridine synthase C [Chlamydiia bacterium]MCH9629861.1 tRNA pseudouridine synthase C [Chlamydiia bacterium]